MFKIGFSKVFMTPPIGTYMAGYAAREGPAIGVLDDLFIRTLYIGLGDKEWVISSLDLTGIDEDFYEDVTKSVEDDLGIPSENIVLSATHTHSGPDTRFYFSDPDDFLLKFIKRQILSSVKLAYQDKDNGRIGFIKSLVDKVSVNRRRPFEGLIDPDFHTIYFKRENKNPILLNIFSCHPTVLGHINRYFSADFPGVLNKYVEKWEGILSMFVAGVAGDINPYTPMITINGKYKRGKTTHKQVEWMGKILAAEAIKNYLLSEKYGSEIKELNSISYITQLRSQISPDIIDEIDRISILKQELANAIKLGDKGREQKIRFELWKLRRIKRLYEIHGSNRVNVHVTILYGGDLAIVFLPGEILVEVGLKIKFLSPFKNTVAVGYSNGYIGYVALSQTYDLHGYETTFPATVLMRGEGEKLVESVLKTLYKIS